MLMRNRAVVAVTVALALARGALGCAYPDTTATVQTVCPSRASFTSVSPFLENGCGTIDCHGAPSRPLRIMGYAGLRLLPSDQSGGNPTTPAEVSANWDSVCGLQPELMTEATTGQLSPDQLLLLQKPLLQTHHKGNQVIFPGDDGDTCLTTWLTGAVDAAACARAAAAQQQP
jgi:hypothetical protein